MFPPSDTQGDTKRPLESSRGTAASTQGGTGPCILNPWEWPDSWEPWRFFSCLLWEQQIILSFLVFLLGLAVSFRRISLLLSCHFRCGCFLSSSISLENSGCCFGIIRCGTLVTVILKLVYSDFLHFHLCRLRNWRLWNHTALKRHPTDVHHLFHRWQGSRAVWRGLIINRAWRRNWRRQRRTSRPTHLHPAMSSSAWLNSVAGSRRFPKGSCRIFSIF